MSGFQGKSTFRLKQRFLVSDIRDTIRRAGSVGNDGAFPVSNLAGLRVKRTMIWLRISQPGLQDEHWKAFSQYRTWEHCQLLPALDKEPLICTAPARSDYGLVPSRKHRA